MPATAEAQTVSTTSDASRSLDAENTAALLLRLGRSAARYVVDKPQSHYVERDGLKLHYFDIGEGTPVVLLHGLAMNGGLNWILPGCVDEIGPGHRLIIPDLRGHGGSDIPEGREAYGFEFVRDVTAILDHLGIDRAHIAGYSLGAMITLKAVTTYPERFLSGTMGGAGWRPCSLKLRHELARIAQQLEEHGEDEGLRAQLIATDVDFETKAACCFLRVIDIWNDTKAMAAMIRSLPELEVEMTTLARTTVPTFGVCGTDDMLYPDAVRLAHVKPNHALKRLPDANHFTAPLNPLFAKAMREFLTTQQAAASN